MKNQKGFSLIELLIVVVIIGIIAAIAIPNLLASRRSANEGSAISSLRTIHGAEMTYQSTVGSGDFAQLTSLQGNQLIDSNLGGGVKSGYNFTSSVAPKSATAPAQFAITAGPSNTATVTATGTRNFAIATDGVIYTGPTSGAGSITLNAANDTTGSFTGGTALNN